MDLSFGEETFLGKARGKEGAYKEMTRRKERRIKRSRFEGIEWSESGTSPGFEVEKKFEGTEQSAVRHGKHQWVKEVKTPGSLFV